MTITLPADFTVRAACTDDFQAITDLVNACSIADKDRTDTIPDHILEVWEETKLATDSFVLLTGTGQIVGYTAVRPDGDSLRLDPHTSVHPDHRQRGLEEALLALAEDRARELIANAEPAVLPQIRGWAFYPRLRQMLLQSGYHVISSILKLEISLTKRPALPQALANIIVRPYRPVLDDRAVHAVIQETFQDIGGRPYQPFEAWVKQVINHRYFDPEQFYVASDHEQLIGAITCRTYQDEPRGHIAQLGVLQPWRNRGIARHLIQRVFAAYSQRGIHHITISVDTHNTTGAIQLYQQLGMSPYEQVDQMLKSFSQDEGV